MPLSPYRERPRTELCYKLWKAKWLGFSLSACQASWRLLYLPTLWKYSFFRAVWVSWGCFSSMCCWHLCWHGISSLVQSSYQDLLYSFHIRPWRMDERSQGLMGRRGRAAEISDILAEEQQQFSWGSLCSGLGKNICIPFLNKKNPSKPNKKKSQQQKIVLRFGFAFTSYLYLCFPPSLHNPKYHALIC